MGDIFRGPSGDALGQPYRRTNSGAWWVRLSYLTRGMTKEAQDCHQKRNKRVTTDGGPSGSMIPVP